MPSHYPKSALSLQRINRPTPSPATLSCRPRSSYSATAFEWQTTLPYASDVPDSVARYHTYSVVGPNQCCSSIIQVISAPIETVWSVVRRFDNPQAYKHYLKSCYFIVGDGDVGTLRRVDVVSGLPAENSIERLDILDDESHVSGFSIIGGEHRLSNYRSVQTLHQSPEGHETVVIESYIVDIPADNTSEDTRCFVGTIIKINLNWLKILAEDLAA